jgi:pimeloyl-ACP methyl ester carboxylesterase
MPRKAMRDVVVCIPGITGSVLRKDGRDIWNISGGALLNALTTLGASITDLKLESDPPDADDLGDGITAPEVIRDVHLIPGFWKIDGYTKMLRYIEETFDVTRGRNLFEFPYDWRRDNRVAARRLQRQGGEWLDAWRASSGASDARLVLVGHSMGGLIARYFLECLDGWQNTRTLVTFGTPYRGSLNALDTLVNGKKIKFFDLTEVARSFTAIHQLLPTYPCYVDGDAKPAYVDEAVIPQLDRAKAKAALDFHREIAAAVERHRGDPAYSERGYELARIVGFKQPTQQSAVRDGDRIKLLRTIQGHDPGGDGTVPRPSATPLELEDDQGATFSAEKHGSLQNDDHLLLQLAGVLTGNTIQWNVFKEAVPMIDLSLDVDDLYSTADPILVRAQPERETTAELLATAVDAETGEVRARHTLAPGDDGWYEAELGPLPEGVYRVTAYGEGPVEPVTDLVTVLAE